MLRSVIHLLVASAFALAVVPRAWMHDCDQEHVDHDHPDHAAWYADLDCEVCATIVAIYDGRYWRSDPGTLVPLHHRYSEVTSPVVWRWMVAASSRGPPLA